MASGPCAHLVGGATGKRIAEDLTPRSVRFEPRERRRREAERRTDARWIVVDQLLGPSQPLDKVTYTFADPREAQKHLHEMWLREIEVVTFAEGKRTVLTDGYAAAPRPPEGATRAAASLEAEGL